MSLVVFPFTDEPSALIIDNLAIAAAHPRVDEVWAVAGDDNSLTKLLRESIEAVSTETSTTIDLLTQERLGWRRPGKGDAMNTAIGRAASQGRERVHFYDADITNFDVSWITGAEEAADRGYGTVRHRFPRASTDGMITWMITRPLLAILFPGTFLPRLNQPLGGEVLLTEQSLLALANSADVVGRSDWGIDTLITYETAVLDRGVYEHHVADGKRHSLYGPLSELRTMVIECLDAAVSLKDRPGPGPEVPHASDPPAPAPLDLRQTIAYDIEGSIALLTEGWTDEEAELAERLPDDISHQVLANRTKAHFSFMDEERWYRVLRHLIDEPQPGDRSYESLVFRLWLMRVLSYTTGEALTGYDPAMGYLEGTIDDYEKWSLG